MRWRFICGAIVTVLGCGPGPGPRVLSVVSDGQGLLRLAVLQNSYWGGGFDRPLFLVFQDGAVIFPRSSDRGIPLTYYILQLNSRGIDSLMASLGVDSILSAVDTLYDFAPNVSDQQSLYFLAPTSAGHQVVQLRSAWRERDSLDARVPFPLANLFKRLRSFDTTFAGPWVPDSIQVSIWPYEYATDNPPGSWLADWPSLSSPRWARHEDALVKEVWTLNLPFVEHPRLDSLLSGLRQKQALGISGRKWAIDYRWILPHEREWRWLADRLES